MTARTFLDHNAGSPLRPEAEAALLAAARAGGNASSVHAEGRAARARAERARDAVAALVGARGDDVVFTSGGTEANATALRPGALLTPEGRPVERLVTVATEHPSVLRGHGFPAGDVTILPVDGAGRLDPDVLHDALSAGDRPALVSIGAVNGETGIVADLVALAAIAAESRAALHVDAVQAAGRMTFAMGSLGASAVTVSGHKLGAPSGIGALVVAPGRAGPRLRLLAGGDQEDRRRGGTENGPGIAAFGAAAEASGRDAEAEASRLAALRDAAESAIRAMAPEVVVFGAGGPRAPGTLCFAVPGLSAETALMALDLDGVSVSSGSACTSGTVGRSHVLAAMGVSPALARGALRVSFGWNSRDEDVVDLTVAFDSLLRRLYGRGAARAA